MSAPNTEQVKSLLEQFVNATSWGESRRIVEQHPEILMPEADALLGRLLEQYQDDARATEVLTEHRDLLCRCREEGIEAAFADRESADVEEAFRAFVEQAESDPEARAALEAMRRQAMEHPLVQAIQALVGTRSPAEVLEAVQVHQSLLSDEADVMIRQGIENARGVGAEEMARHIEQRYETLRQIREQGIEPGELEAALEAHPELREASARVAQQAASGLGLGDIPEDLRPILQKLFRLVRRADMPRRIQLCEQALNKVDRRTNSTLWAALQNELANSLAQTPTGERAENIERAIHHYSLALEVCSRQAFPVDWAATNNNLANAYLKRIRGERAENIERAIHHYEQALQVYTPQGFCDDWAMAQSNLANAYLKRIRGERAENIERAIHHYERALQVYTRQAFPERWAMTQNNLAAAYVDRIRGGRTENIEQAIDHCERALQVYSYQAFPVDWAGIQNRLANAYFGRIRGERAENLERAIHYCNRALQVYTRQAFPADWAGTQNNLGIAYIERIRGEQAENLERAIQHCTQALEVYTSDTWPERARDVRRRLGAAHFALHSWPAAHEAFAVAQDLTEQFYAAALLREVKEQEIGANARMVAQDAFCLAKMGCPEKAWHTLESGRARALRQGLDRATARRALATAAPEIRKRYETLAGRDQALREAMRLPEDDARHRRYHEVRDELASVTQELHGLENDLLEAAGMEIEVADVEDILGLPLLQDGRTALISLTLTDHGALAFLLTVDGIEHTFIEGLTRDDVQTLVIPRREDEDAEPGGWLGAYFLRFLAHDRWQATITETLAALGRRLWPALDGMLQEAGVERVVLLPQGMLFLLPLHACTLGEDECVCDRYAVAYSPAGSVLARLASGEGASAIEHSLLVANPTGDLPHTPSEARAIQDTLGNTLTLWECEATEASVVEAAREAGVIHFSGHGAYVWQAPEQSGLLLRDPDSARVNVRTGEGVDPLTVAEMRDALRLSRTRLVTLSACETGLTEIGRGLADEYIGLPGILLQAGARAVVASLWAVDDLATALLMWQFYRAWERGVVPIAEALRQAQKWLRTRTREQVKDDLKKLDALWAPWAAQTDDPAMKRRAREQYWEIRHARQRLERMDDPPFAHPYWWAGFQAVGDVL